MTRAELAEKYTRDHYYSYDDAEAHREIASGAHEAGQDEGFEEALRRLCGPGAHAKLEEWERVGLKPTAAEWARWLREKRWE